MKFTAGAQSERIVSVLVIGGGQAGLAVGYHLKARGVPFRIVETENRIGASWRKRYASLTLFTPRRFSALPGMELPGDPEGYAARDEFAGYLERYADTLGLPVATGMRVEKLTRVRDGHFQALLSTGETIRARHVIVATGGFRIPVVPDLAKGFTRDVTQFTAESYGDGSMLPSGPILVVGDGASGRDIATELAVTHRVLLATGKSRRLLPERILGRSIWWWLNAFGLMTVSGSSLPGRLMRRADPFPDRDRNLTSLRRKGIKVMPRLIGAEGHVAHFADGRSATITAIVWATGYRDNAAWLDIPGAVDVRGRFIHRGGLSPVPGLFFLGRPWQRNRASALIMGVGADAAFIADAITGQIQRMPAALAASPLHERRHSLPSSYQKEMR